MFVARLARRQASTPSSLYVPHASQIRYASRQSYGTNKGIRDHWSKEKLATSEDMPLTEVLSNVMHPKMEPKKEKKKGIIKRQGPRLKTMSSVHVRTQIVSEKLCDDVLAYIGPTLEKHKGCDILDINPGACLWSQKLHEFLQPRSHILLEPKFETFKSMIDPLLAAPNSKYKLVEKDPTLLDTYRDMINENCFPHQTRLDPADPQAQQANNSLLVTGSIVWDPQLPGKGFDSMAKQVYSLFTSASWTNDLFHAFGLVRTLLWTPHDEFSSMIARSMSTMYKYNRYVEMTHDLFTAVAASRKTRNAGVAGSRREPQYEIESAIRALDNAKANGIELPEHRRDLMFDFAQEIKDLSGGSGRVGTHVVQQFLHDKCTANIRPEGLLYASVMDAYEEEARIRKEFPEITILPLITENKTKKAPSIKLDKEHPALERIRAFRRNYALAVNIIRTKRANEAIADKGEEMYVLECKALKMPDGSEKDALLKQIEDMDRAIDRDQLAIPSNYSSQAASETDERISLRHYSEPRIQWDSRPFEPLLMFENEAWPQNRLTLVSATPKPRPAHVSLVNGDVEWLRDFIFGLYNEPARSVVAGLDSMQHGMSELIKDCPSLRDPDKGGRLQMKHLRVRMLTVEMIEELVAAYRAWPFKAAEGNHDRVFRNQGAKYGGGGF